MPPLARVTPVASKGQTRRLPLAGACCLAWTALWPALWPAPARAQTLDRDDLEQLFGEPVTTSATGKPQRASQVPANVEIITAEEIRRSVEEAKQRMTRLAQQGAALALPPRG